LRAIGSNVVGADGRKSGREQISSERRASEMDTHKLRRACISVGVVILYVILFTSNAFPWGSATHAYIDDKIGKKLPLKNLNEIYGGMAADIFNFYPEVLVPTSEYYYLYVQTHYNPSLWSEARRQSDLEKARHFILQVMPTAALVPTPVFTLVLIYTHMAPGNDPVIRDRQGNRFLEHFEASITGPTNSFR
jgi:hypothetical protein